MTIGTTQFKSIRKPNKRFPISAPPLPNVRDNAAAITLYIITNLIKVNYFFNKIKKNLP